MSNLIWAGINFNNQLIQKWFLQNSFQPQIGETQEMGLKILDYQDNGFEFTTVKTNGISPNFAFRSKLGLTSTDVFTFNTTTSKFTFNFPVIVPIPLTSSEAANKGYVDTQLGTTGTVKSIGITTNTDALSITNTPVTGNGNINIDLPAILQNIKTIGYGTNGQVIATTALNTLGWINPGTVTSIAIAVNNGITVSPVTSITTSGTFTLGLNTNLTGFGAIGFPNISGQVLTSNGTTAIWQNSSSGGNVTGAATTTLNALAVWGNTSGSSIINSTYVLDGSGNLTIGTKRITTAGDPIDPQDYSTKNYTDVTIAALKNKFRSGTVVVGDIGNTGTVSLTTTGGILTATKSNGYSQYNSFIDITFTNLGYIPLGIFGWSDPTNNETINDVGLIVVQTSTNSTMRIFLGEATLSVKNGTLSVLLMHPNI